ncbi:DUF5677 domain-containing protein [Marinobacter confluentis]|uniref:Uncharacterized protein n=1 Tax=Marinobacter confluentis TaxID=1697557 RepID=A0A4Z1C3G9_9GAMM|nr:DUF5677 domain-containing protein [Marinobacter confluentis]TGN40681.1 hypothetical protein E5Q11_10600 [Marinobacter confluentis]
MKDELAVNFRRTATELELALDIVGNTKSDATSHVLSCLFREAYREIERLFQFSDDLTFASLSVRNLFELYLISQHVHSDKKALSRWLGQTHKDSKDVRDGFITLMRKKGFNTKELEELQEFEDRALAESPFTSNGPFQMRDLAKKYGHLDDYYFIYKLSSKLIHPTSMKIMGYEALNEESNYLTTVLQVGAYFSHRYRELVHHVVSEKA